MTTTHSPELSEIAKALAAAQAEFSAVPKTANNPFFKSSYADLASVVATAGPVLGKHELAVTQLIGVTDDGGDTLTTMLLHSSGQYIADSMRLYLVKNDPQGQGSATTYARRYAYMAILGLVADVDDDGNKATRKIETQQSRQEVPQSAIRKSPAKKVTDDETGEIVGTNMQSLMLSEIKDKDDRTKFFDEMTKRSIKLSAVPSDRVAEVEKLIGEWAAGRPFA